MSANTALANVLATFEVTKFAYCHCDHFEPWRSDPQSIGSENAAMVADFAHATTTIEEARRLTLFYRTHIKPVALPREGARSADGDSFGFLGLSEEQLAITSPAIRTLVDAGHELQVHIHHERMTSNRKYALTSRWSDDLAHAGRDSARMGHLIDLSLEQHRRETGLAYDRWLFVHGNWALAASDPDVCCIEDELALLHARGCVGDFTFTGAPRHAMCEPNFDRPSLVDLTPGRTSYNRAVRAPVGMTGSENGSPASRFFIWSSPLARIACGLDYTNPIIAQFLGDPVSWALLAARQLVKVDDTLYFMTYAHSVSAPHGTQDRMLYPHQHPAVRAMLGTMLDTASAAGLEVEFLGAMDVYRRCTGTP